MAGFYLMQRGWMDSGCFRDEPFCERAAWIWLIENAAYAERKIIHNGKPLTIQRGQVFASRRFLAAAWKWDDNRASRFLKKLEMMGHVATGNGPGQTLITICNYNEFQLGGNGDGPDLGQQRARLGPAAGQGVGHERAKVGPKYKEGNEGKEMNEGNELDLGAGNPPAPAKRKPAPRRRNTIPDDDWKPSDKLTAELKSKGWTQEQIDRQTRKRVDYCRANGKAYADHDAAFRNWMSGPFQNEKPGQHAPPQPPGRLTAFERDCQRLDEWAASFERQHEPDDHGGPIIDG